MWWLVYVRCDDCPDESCIACKRSDRSLRLKRICSETRPANALYGPCASFRDLLDPSWRLFEFNEASDELMFNFKVD
jgi:hypothetical protein